MILHRIDEQEQLEQGTCFLAFSCRSSVSDMATTSLHSGHTICLMLPCISTVLPAHTHQPRQALPAGINRKEVSLGKMFSNESDRRQTGTASHASRYDHVQHIENSFHHGCQAHEDRISRICTPSMALCDIFLEERSERGTHPVGLYLGAKLRGPQAPLGHPRSMCNAAEASRKLPRPQLLYDPLLAQPSWSQHRCPQRTPVMRCTLSEARL